MKALHYIHLSLHKLLADGEFSNVYETHDFETPAGAEAFLVKGEAEGRWELNGAWIGCGSMSTEKNGAMYGINQYLLRGGKKHIALIREQIFSVSD